MKLESKVNVGIFLDQKLYVIQNEKGELIKKAKGFPQNQQTNLTLNAFKDGLNLVTPQFKHTSAYKNFKRDFTGLKISRKDYKKPPIRTVRYSRRLKVLNSNQKWVDTQPVIVDL
jgi:hypothetical protein